MLLRRSRVVVAIMLVAALGASGCSRDEGPRAAESAWPLTGLPGYPSDHNSQVVTVKIENTSAGHPQEGIGDADLIVEEMVEGGLTRLAAMYQSTYPSVAGPVRSLRETDIGVVRPTDGTLAASGGEEATVAMVQAAGVPIVVEGGTGFFRDPARSAPYDLMLDVGALSASLPDGGPGEPYLPFGGVPADASASPAAAIELDWPSASTAFQWDAGAGLWVRSDMTDPEGYDVTTVLALSMPVTDSGGTDAAGTPIPVMQTEGSGHGVVATGGQTYEVTWSKPTPSSPWSLSYRPPGDDTSARDFTIPAGRTWIGLLPDDGGSVDVTAP